MKISSLLLNIWHICSLWINISRYLWKFWEIYVWKFQLLTKRVRGRIATFSMSVFGLSLKRFGFMVFIFGWNIQIWCNSNKLKSHLKGALIAFNINQHNFIILLKSHSNFEFILNILFNPVIFTSVISVRKREYGLPLVKLFALMWFK